MMRPTLQPSDIIGPAAVVLEAARRHVMSTGVRRRGPAGFAVLLDGDPGIGKTAVADILAAELAGHTPAVEHVNGQSVTAELVRAWAVQARCGNLFSSWTVKRIDELDHASHAGMAELLTLLDYLPHQVAVLATTNELGKLRALSKGRLETRFVRFPVAAPSVEQVSALLRSEYRVPAAVARQIAAGSVPEGAFELAGCNVRAALRDAEAFVAAAGGKAVAS